MLFLVLVVVMVFFAYLYTRPVLPVLSIDKVYNVTEVGETVPVNVTLSNIRACGGWNMNLTWDPYYIRPLTIKQGPFFKAANLTSFFVLTSLDNEKGELIVADVFVSEGAYANGTGVILMLNFTVVRVGTTTIELHSPAPNGTRVAVGDATRENQVDHAEVNGLITNEGPPPMWASTDFQNTMIIGEVAALSVISGVIYLRTHPRPPKTVKRKAELQPLIDQEDQLDND